VTALNNRTDISYGAISFPEPQLRQIRSQCPRGLRRRFAAARLLRLWVRITQGSWMFTVIVYVIR